MTAISAYLYESNKLAGATGRGLDKPSFPLQRDPWNRPIDRMMYASMFREYPVHGSYFVHPTCAVSTSASSSSSSNSSYSDKSIRVASDSEVPSTSWSWPMSSPDEWIHDGDEWIASSSRCVIVPLTEAEEDYVERAHYKSRFLQNYSCPSWRYYEIPRDHFRLQIVPMQGRL